MNKRRLFDQNVNEVFGLFGVEVAIYFEALRYRQQLTPDKFFAFSREKIKEKIDLTYRQQERVRKILVTTDWIETRRGFKKGGGTVTLFHITEFAQNLIKDTKRKRNTDELRRELTLRLSS